tara:strand:+ start:1156 stop:2118 length:963 start_codon:yes stop_codon:yes gene_type:complete
MKKKSNISLAKEIIKREIVALNRTLKRIDSNFDKACKVLSNVNGKVITIGLGKSGYIAMKMSGTLSSTGTPSLFIHAADALHGDMGAIKKNDVIIIYSKSGETDEIIKLLPLLKILKCPIISITGDITSSLAKYSDISIDASVTREACPNNLAPSSSIVCALALSDALALTISSQKNFSVKDFAKTHPEGTLGKRLLKTVRDIMATKNIPLLKDTSSFDDLIKRTTKGNLGMAVILNNKNNIVGVISDGDIKRIMKSHKNLTDIILKNVMTKKPLKVSSNMLAAEALSILETNSINALPVVENLKVKGIVTLQMIIKSLN